MESSGENLELLVQMYTSKEGYESEPTFKAIVWDYWIAGDKNSWVLSNFFAYKSSNTESITPALF